MWKDSAELSYVSTSGNAESSTVGFQNTLARKQGFGTLAFKVRGIRAESTVISRTAVGTASDYDVREDSDSQVSAENYQAILRFDRKVSDFSYWYTDGSWERNRPTGINNRYIAAGGWGSLWVDSERFRFRTEYAATFTRQEDVIESPEKDDTFAGARLSSEFIARFGEGRKSEYKNEFIYDGNLEETSDFRATMTNSIAVTMTTHLKLKAALQWLYDNEPSLALVDLFDAGGSATGLQVLAELDELDTIFTTSLVFDF